MASPMPVPSYFVRMSTLKHAKEAPLLVRFDADAVVLDP